MRFLLDTHALLWALAEPHRLSPHAADLIRDPSNQIVVSAASAWEIATKHRLGKLPGAEPIVAGFVAHLVLLRAEQLPIHANHALAAGNFVTEHRDPFDRMLAAQAMVEGLPFLTADPVFSAFPGLEIVW